MFVVAAADAVAVEIHRQDGLGSGRGYAELGQSGGAGAGVARAGKSRRGRAPGGGVRSSRDAQMLKL